MNSRRILIILSIVALLIIVGIGFYFLFSGSSTTITPPTGTGQTGSLPPAGNQNNPGSNTTTGGATGTTPTSGNTVSATGTVLGKNFGVISSEPTLDYFVNAANTVTAIKPDGTIIQVVSGQETTLSSLPLQNIISAGFSYNGAKIMVNFGDPANPQTSIFDVAAKAWTPLKAGLLSPAWSPSDYRIAYGMSGPNGTESFATLDVSKSKPAPVALTTLHVQDLTVAWPGKNQIILSTKPSGVVAGSAWSFNPQASTLTPVALDASGLSILWNSSRALQFSAGGNGFGGSLALTDSSGAVTQRIKFLTLPSKCSFASATSSLPAAPSSTVTISTTTSYLFCGVPRDQTTFSGSNLPDDYNQMSLFTSDDIYRINLQSGAVDTIYNDRSQNLDASDVKFFNGMLFFINRYDQKLYAISLSV